MLNTLRLLILTAALVVIAGQASAETIALAKVYWRCEGTRTVQDRTIL
jgi:hypothetical protein